MCSLRMTMCIQEDGHRWSSSCNAAQVLPVQAWLICQSAWLIIATAYTDTDAYSPACLHIAILLTLKLPAVSCFGYTGSHCDNTSLSLLPHESHLMHLADSPSCLLDTAAYWFCYNKHFSHRKGHALTGYAHCSSSAMLRGARSKQLTLEQDLERLASCLRQHGRSAAPRIRPTFKSKVR